MESLYAFCRTVDDLADEYPVEIGRPLLDEWWRWIDGLERRAGAPAGAGPRPAAGENRLLTAALLDVVERFGVPPRSLRLLVEGVRSDTERSTIGTFVELQEYCYRVAGTVGVALCHVLGTASPEAYGRAARLGMAMQLTNVLRDVGEDLGGAGSTSRPRTWPASTARAGAVRAAGHAAVRRPDAPRDGQGPELLRRRAPRGVPAPGGVPPADPGGGAAYRAILGRIEAQAYDVFSRRAATSRPAEAAHRWRGPPHPAHGALAPAGGDPAGARGARRGAVRGRSARPRSG